VIGTKDQKKQRQQATEFIHTMICTGRLRIFLTERKSNSISKAKKV
jgi:hypothetical protein